MLCLFQVIDKNWLKPARLSIKPSACCCFNVFHFIYGIFPSETLKNRLKLAGLSDNCLTVSSINAFTIRIID